MVLSQVSVALLPVDVNRDFSRNFILSCETPTLPIGRSSKRGLHNRTPAHDNAWYESRVISRDHADLELSLENKTVYIRDCGSTHGTWLNDRKLPSHEPVALVNGDILRFGVDVERDSEDFPALSVCCKVHWLKEETPQEPHQDHVLEPQPHSESNPAPMIHLDATRTFCPPDYDSDVVELGPFMPLSIHEEAGGADANVSDGPVDHPKLPSPDPDYPDITILNDDEAPAPELPAEIALEPSHAHPDHAEELMMEEDESSFDYTDEDENEEDDEESEEGNEDESEQDSDEEDDVVGSDAESLGPSDVESSVSSSLSYTGDGDQLSSDSVVYNLSSESDSNSESDSESSSADSDNEAPVSHEAECIDPSVLSQKPKKDTLEKTISGHVEHTGLIGHSIADFTQACIPDVLNQPPPRLPRPVSLGEYTHRILREPNLRGVCYNDGPFSLGSIPMKEADTKETVKEEVDSVAGVTSLKRKASEMDSIVVVENETTDAPSKEESDAKLATNSQVADAISSALSETEPPRKRVKSNESQSSKIASYTATAVISALLGGLGTIALLASLPPEYFQ